MVQRLAFLLLAAAVSLLGTVVPVEAASVAKRVTNGELFMKGLPPLPPVKRSGTNTAKRSQVSPKTGGWFGRLMVSLVSDGTTVGYVANDKLLGPTGVDFKWNSSETSTPADDVDLRVKLVGSNLIAQNPVFNSPHYIGGDGTLPLGAGSANTVAFTNVDSGPSAAIWTIDARKGVLNATWTNSDGSKIKPSLVYDLWNNTLNFTGDPALLFATYFPPTYPVYLTITS